MSAASAARSLVNGKVNATLAIAGTRLKNLRQHPEVARRGQKFKPTNRYY